jgi:hypothetical protein
MKAPKLTRAIAHAHGVHLFNAKGVHRAIHYSRPETGPEFAPRPHRPYHPPELRTPVLPANFCLA